MCSSHFGKINKTANNNNNFGDTKFGMDEQYNTDWPISTKKTEAKYIALRR